MSPGKPLRDTPVSGVCVCALTADAIGIVTEMRGSSKSNWRGGGLPVAVGIIATHTRISRITLNVDTEDELK